MPPLVVWLRAAQLPEGLSPGSRAPGRPTLHKLPFPLHLHSCWGRVGVFSFLTAHVRCKSVLFAMKAPADSPKNLFSLESDSKSLSTDFSEIF